MILHFEVQYHVLARDRPRLVAVLSIMFLQAQKADAYAGRARQVCIPRGPQDFGTAGLGIKNICAGDALAGDRLRLAVLLSINFLSRNGANELKKLMLTPGGRGRSASRGAARFWYRRSGN